MGLVYRTVSLFEDGNVTETFNQRDKLIAMYDDYKQFFDGFNEVARKKVIEDRLSYGYYTKEMYYVNFGDNLYDHPYMKYIHSLSVTKHKSSFYISLRLDIDGKWMALSYSKGPFHLLTSLWTVSEDGIGAFLPDEIHEEIKNNPFFPDQKIDWNDNHHMMFKLMYHDRDI